MSGEEVLAVGGGVIRGSTGGDDHVLKSTTIYLSGNAFDALPFGFDEPGKHLGLFEDLFAQIGYPSLLNQGSGQMRSNMPLA